MHERIHINPQYEHVQGFQRHETISDRPTQLSIDSEINSESLLWVRRLTIFSAKAAQTSLQPLPLHST
jgi:hypothetical protein